jgi:hypothetical protein
MRRRLGVGLVILTSRDDAVGPGYIHFGMSGGREAEFRPWGEYYGSRDPRKIYIDAEPIGSVYTESQPDPTRQRGPAWPCGHCAGTRMARLASISKTCCTIPLPLPRERICLALTASRRRACRDSCRRRRYRSRPVRPCC